MAHCSFPYCTLFNFYSINLWVQLLRILFKWNHADCALKNAFVFSHSSVRFRNAMVYVSYSFVLMMDQQSDCRSVTVYYYPLSCCPLGWLVLIVNVIQLMYCNAGGKGGYTAKRLQEILGVMDLLIILVSVLISWVYTYVKTYQLVCLHMCSLLCVHNTSIKILRKN